MAHESRGADEWKMESSWEEEKKEVCGVQLGFWGLDGQSVADPKPAQTRQGGASE